MKTYKGLAIALAAVVLASGGGIASSVVTAAPAQAATIVSTPAEVSAAVTKIFNDTNAARKAAGLAPLTLAPSINAVAQNWTDQEATGNFINPRPNLWKEIPPSLSWAAGQNNSLGLSADLAVPYWMANGYTDQILGNYTHIGIGYTVDENGTIYIAQNFGRYTTTPSALYPSDFYPNPTSFAVVWKGRVTPNKESLTDFKVELYSPTGTLLQTKTVVYDPNVVNPAYVVEFTGLDPETTYTVKTTARNASVMGIDYFSPTRVETVKTGRLIPAPQAPNAPTFLTASNTLHNQTTLSWKAPTGLVGNPTGYNVTVKQAGKADRTFWTEGTTYPVTGLAENTAYTAEVTARVQGEDGVTNIVSPAATTSFKTTIYYPVAVSAPTNYALSNVTSDAATLSWKAPVSVTGKLVDYTVIVNGPTGEKTYRTASTSYRITGLTAKTDYGISIQANAVSLDGLNHAIGHSGGIVFSTAAAPSPIVKVAAPAVSVTGVGADRMTVAWIKPAVTGTITGYRVTVKQGTVVKQTHNLTAATYAKAVVALAENTTYTVVIEALAVAPNGVNKATGTTTKIVKTGFTAASTVKVAAPAAFAATASRTAITATWRMPAVTGKVLNYTVTLKEGTRTVKTIVVVGGKYSFTGLKANTAYTVSVQANAVSANGKYKATSPAASKALRTLR